MHYTLSCIAKLVVGIRTKDVYTKQLYHGPKKIWKLKITVQHFSLRIADRSMVCIFKCYYTTFEVS